MASAMKLSNSLTTVFNPNKTYTYYTPCYYSNFLMLLDLICSWNFEIIAAQLT